METRKVTFQAHGKQIVCQTPLMKWAMQNRACRPDKVATHYVKQVIIHFVASHTACQLPTGKETKRKKEPECVFSTMI
ncbi:hypothetical protein Y1Q_0009392 [Alligator mississippiensis]|uniref:Uncharacterized protein n=1 Tax=Alligator mississippiensis TaxID=8496 RepID=A0A151N884_ALLMI|nr:hypothetical protein Y1Q_0009392 [Alligator mississippiensis]